MKLQVSKTVTEEMDIQLPVPKYTKFYNSMYYKFYQSGENIIVQSFDFDITASKPFELKVSMNLDLYIDGFNCVLPNYTQIDEVEYDNMLRECLFRFGILSPESPTLHRQEPNY